MKKKSFYKFKFIEKYEVDFWGYLTSCSNGKKRFFLKMFQIFCFKYRNKIRLIKSLFLYSKLSFKYSTLLEKKRLNKMYDRSYIKNLHTLLKFRTYYGDMTIKKFRKYLQKVNKRRIDFIIKLCFLLETRLDILLFRMNFVKNPREARSIIKLNNVKVNYKIVNRLNHQIYINDIITIKGKYNTLFNYNLLNKLINNNILFNYPRYLEVNYKIMTGMFISYPKREDIPSTWKLDFSFLRNFI